MDKITKKKLRELLKEDNISSLKMKLTTILKKLDKEDIKLGNRRAKKKITIDKNLTYINPKLSAKAKEYRRNLIEDITSSEKAFKQFLNNHEIQYTFQKIFYTKETFYIADFYIILLYI